MVWIFFILSIISSIFHPSGILAIDSDKKVFCNYTAGWSAPTQLDTALGCIPFEIGPFTTWLLGWIFGVTGGIAFLMMVYGFFLMSTSSGDPKAVAGAKETVTSAIQGLLVSIFGVFILRLIALNILQLPGL